MDTGGVLEKLRADKKAEKDGSQAAGGRKAYTKAQRRAIFEKQIGHKAGAHKGKKRK